MIKHTAYITSTEAEARYLRQRLFKTNDDYVKQNIIYIGSTATRWEGFRFSLIIVTGEAQNFLVHNWTFNQREEFFDALQRRLDRGGILLTEFP